MTPILGLSVNTSQALLFLLHDGLIGWLSVGSSNYTPDAEPRRTLGTRTEGNSARNHTWMLLLSGYRPHPGVTKRPLKRQRATCRTIEHALPDKVDHDDRSNRSAFLFNRSLLRNVHPSR